MRYLLVFLSFLSLVLTKTYFTYDHLVSWPRPSSMVLSPDSSQGLYFTTTYSLSSKNVTVEAFVIKFAHSDDNSLPTTYNVTLLFHKLSEKLTSPLNLVWLDSNTFSFHYKSALWTLDVPDDLNDLDKGDPEKLQPPNQLSPLKGLHDVDDLKYHAESKTLIFSAKVQKSNYRREFGDSGRLYDQLFVRHWDHWVDNTAKKQLFYAKVNKQVGVHKDDKLQPRWSLQREPTNLLISTELETPVAPFGDSSDFSVSKDGKQVAFVAKYPDRTQAWSTKSDVYVVSTEGGRPKSLTEDNFGACSKPVFSPDGKYLAWLQMNTPQYEADKNHIIVYDLQTKNRTEIASWWDRSPQSLIWSGQSDKLFVTAEEMGRTKLFYVVPKTNKVRRVTKYDQVSNLQFLKEDIYVATLSSLYAPPEFYTIEVDNYFKLNRQSNLNAERATNYFLDPHEDFFFSGADGHDIHGMLLKPPNFRSWRKYPLALLIHGGPQGSWSNAWSYRWNPQIFANAGYVVVMINPHGSTGYGQNFTDEIKEDWGGKPYKDIMAGLDYVLEEYSFVDKQRVAALGGSYGGYMVNWINGHTNRFRVLVNHDGMFDATNAYYTTDELYFNEHEFGGLPWENKETYDKFSPANFVWKWATPTLVIHSRMDYRLTMGEGLATFTALQRQGVQSKLLYFEDENHWVSKHANSRRWNSEVLNWINRYCRPYFYELDQPLTLEERCIEGSQCYKHTVEVEKVDDVEQCIWKLVETDESEVEPKVYKRVCVEEIELEEKEPLKRVKVDQKLVQTKAKSNRRQKKFLVDGKPPV